MPNPATVVGNKFALKYYTALSQQPQAIANYYKVESSFTFGVGSFEVASTDDSDTETFFGVENIQKKISSLNFQGCKVEVSSINCQESLNGGIIVVVLGTIALKQQDHFQTPRPFTQTFFLGIQNQPVLSYFVLNDFFRFLNVSANSVNQQPKSVIPASVAPTTSFTVATLQKQPETVTVAPTNVSATPEVTHSPIPAPQTTLAPVVEKVAPQQPPQHQNHPPATTTAPVTTTTVATDAKASTKPENNGGKNLNGKAKPPRSDSQKNEDWKQVPKKSVDGARPPRNNNNKNRDQQDQKPPKSNKSGNNSQRKEKKAENQTPNESNDHSNNHQVRSAPNSWARIALPSATTEQAVVFAPPPVVYTAPPEEKKEEKKEKKEKKEPKADKPKKDKPKREDPERLAWKKTRDLRSVRVDNLPFSATDAQVYDLFSQFGPIAEAVVKKGFAYVEYQSVTGVTNVLNHTRKSSLYMEGTTKDGKKVPRELTVEQRKPRVSAEPEKPFFKEEAKKLQQEAEKAEKAEKAQNQVAPTTTN